MPTNKVRHHAYSRMVQIGSAIPVPYIPVVPPKKLFAERWHDFIYRVGLWKVTFLHRRDDTNINTFIVIAVSSEKASEHVAEWITSHFGDDFPHPMPQDYIFTVDHLADIGSYVQGVVSYSYVW